MQERIVNHERNARRLGLASIALSAATIIGAVAIGKHEADQLAQEDQIRSANAVLVGQGWNAIPAGDGVLEVSGTAKVLGLWTKDRLNQAQQGANEIAKRCEVQEKTAESDGQKVLVVLKEGTVCR